MKSKYWLKLIAPVLILVLAIVLFFTVGFNKSLELRGYYLLEVNIGDYELSEALDKIENVLNDKEITIEEYIPEEDDYGMVIAIKYTTTDSNEHLQENIKDELFTEFAYNSSSLLEQTYIKVSDFIQPQSMTAPISSILLAVLIGLVGIFVYIALRHSTANAFSIVLSAILDVLLMISLTIILRLPISSSFALAIAGTMVFSVILNTLQYSKFIENSNDEKMLKLNNDEIIKISQQMFSKELIVLIMSYLFAVCVFAFYNLSTSLSLVFGILSSVYVSQLVTPHLWAMAYRRRVRTKKENKTAVNND